MNTNDFSKCEIGDKLWSIQLGDCFVISLLPIRARNSNEEIAAYSKSGLYYCTDKHQSLFFSNPNIIAPPEPPRLPDYKPGQWIAVCNDGTAPKIRRFLASDNSGNVICVSNGGNETWPNHCTLEELPEVLAKWGEPK